jgi:hypothetical protein
MSAATVGVRSRTILAGILAAAAALAGTAVTDAAWVDDEYVHTSGIGTDGRCATDSGVVTTASARQLSGMLMGSDLDSLASVRGVNVSNDGEGTSTANAGALPIDDDTYIAPLDVGLLAADVLRLSLPLGLPVGSADAYSQWGQTLDNGNATGATGLITNSGGGIAIGGPQDPSDPPIMATINLAQLAPGALAGMTLDVGAASSIADLTLCGDLGNGWLGPLDQPLIDRDYGLSVLDLNSNVPALGTAVTGADQLLDSVQPALDAANGPLASGIESGLLDAAGTLLGTLNAGAVDVQVATTPADLAPVRALLSGTRTDQRGLLTVDFGTGTVRVDLAKTTGGANGLNNLAPNTELVLDQAVLAELSAALVQVLGDWQREVDSALLAAVRGMSVTVNATVEVRQAGLSVAEIQLGLGPVAAGSLVDIHHGVPGAPAVPVTSDVTIPGLDPFGVLEGLLNPVAAGLSAQLAGITGGALDNVLGSGILNDFTTSIASLLSPVAGSFSAALDLLSSLLSIMVNVQPDQPGYPGAATANPFEVTALRLSLIQDGGTLNLSVATASVGYGH